MSEQVTIIMPVHNPGKYLRPCLDSLLAQTMKDFRIIAIDDGSTDGAWNILQEYAVKDERILLQKNPYNIGAARTRNIGIQLAKGEYIVIIDADDYFEPDYLACLWAACKESNLDIAICSLYLRNEDSGEEYLVTNSRRFEEIICNVFNWKDLPDYIFSLFYISSYVKMYRREFIMEFSLEFQDLHNCNDAYFGDMGLIYAKRICYIPKALMHYRFNTGNQITNRINIYPYCVYDALKKISCELHRIGVFEEVKKSFFYHSVGHILCIARHLSNDIYNEFCNFWIERGLSGIGLEDVEYDGVDVTEQRWKYFLQHKSCMFIFENDMFKVNVYERFFQEIKKRGLQLAHWGYGKLGKDFAELAKKYHCSLVEVYDRDKQKWDLSNDPPVKQYMAGPSDIDLIVMTNKKFEDDIVSNLQKGIGGKIFDFSAYMEYHLEFDFCMIDVTRSV